MPCRITQRMSCRCLNLCAMRRALPGPLGLPPRRAPAQDLEAAGCPVPVDPNFVTTDPTVVRVSWLLTCWQALKPAWHLCMHLSRALLGPPARRSGVTVRAWYAHTYNPLPFP